MAAKALTGALVQRGILDEQAQSWSGCLDRFRVALREEAKSGIERPERPRGRDRKPFRPQYTC